MLAIACLSATTIAQEVTLKIAHPFPPTSNAHANILLPWMLPGYTPGRFPNSEVFELPLLVQSDEQASRAEWDYGQKHLIDDFKGVKLLSIQAHDTGLLLRAKKLVHTLEDLHGEKSRAPNRVANKNAFSPQRIDCVGAVYSVAGRLEQRHFRRLIRHMGSAAVDQD